MGFSVPDWLVDRVGTSAPVDPPDPAEVEREAARRYGRILSASAAASRGLAGLDGRFARDTDFADAPLRYREELEAIGREQEESFGDDRVGRNLFRRDFIRLADHAVHRFELANAQREAAHWARTLEDRWDSLAALIRGADGEGRAEILRQAAMEAHRARSFGLVPDANEAFQGFLARIGPGEEADRDSSERGRGPWGSQTAEYRRDRDGEAAMRTAEHRVSDGPGEMRLLSAGTNGEGSASTDGASAAPDETQVAEETSQKAPTKQKPAPSPAESPLSDAERGRMLDELSVWEGKISDRKNDPLTHYGVTDEGLKDYKSRAAPDDPIMKKEVKGLTYADARIILDEIMRQYRADRIENPHLRQHIFDMIVNHSPQLGIKMWQQVLNESGVLSQGVALEEDGTLGPATRAAINGLNEAQQRAINEAAVQKRVEFYRDFVRRHPEKKDMENGLINRANSFQLP